MYKRQTLTPAATAVFIYLHIHSKTIPFLNASKINKVVNKCKCFVLYTYFYTEYLYILIKNRLSKTNRMYYETDNILCKKRTKYVNLSLIHI